MNEQTSTISPADHATQPFRVVLRNVGGVTPFATHLENMTPDGKMKPRRDLYSGHYFEHQADAQANFEERCAAYNLKPIAQPLTAFEKAFVVVALGFWGKGDTLTQAAKECRKAGGKGVLTCVAYCYTRDTVVNKEKPLLSELSVDGMGGINYPANATSIYLFGPTAGNSVKLSALCKR